MVIDEEREKALVKIVKTKKGNEVKVSDHNPIITQFNVHWDKQVRKVRVEMYNLKNKECQDKFKDLTSQHEILSSSLSSKDDLNTSTRKFLKSLNKCITKCFKKIRIVDKPNKEMDKLFDERRKLRNKTDENSRKELEMVENKLSEMILIRKD